MKWFRDAMKWFNEEKFMTIAFVAVVCCIAIYFAFIKGLSYGRMKNAECIMRRDQVIAELNKMPVHISSVSVCLKFLRTAGNDWLAQ